MRRPVARGRVRAILVRVGRIQDAVGWAIGTAQNDRNPRRMDALIPLLGQAFDECVAIRDMYARIPEGKAKA